MATTYKVDHTTTMSATERRRARLGDMELNVDIRQYAVIRTVKRKRGTYWRSLYRNGSVHKEATYRTACVNAIADEFGIHWRIHIKHTLQAQRLAPLEEH